MWVGVDLDVVLLGVGLLLDVIGVASKRARKLRLALDRLDSALRHAFPMKLHIPLLLTVWASVTCTSYKPLDAAALLNGHTTARAAAIHEAAEGCQV